METEITFATQCKKEGKLQNGDSKKMAAFQVFIEFAKQQEAEDNKDEEGNKNKYFTEKETDCSNSLY